MRRVSRGGGGSAERNEIRGRCEARREGINRGESGKPLSGFYSDFVSPRQTVSCTSGVMRWHLVRLVGVSPASFHTFNRCTMGYNDVGKEGRACSPTSETNKYCPSAALFRCPRNQANTSRTSYSLKWSGR